MNILHKEDGTIVIKGDEHLLANIEGQSLESVDVSDLRVTADNLSKLYDKACVSTGNLEHIKRYAVMKAKYLETFTLPEEVETETEEVVEEIAEEEPSAE